MTKKKKVTNKCHLLKFLPLTKKLGVNHISMKIIHPYSLVSFQCLPEESWRNFKVAFTTYVFKQTKKKDKWILLLSEGAMYGILA